MKKVSRRNVYYHAHWQRLRDAQALFEQRRWVGCIYLAGIAVECVLKYAVCVKEEAVYLAESSPDLLGARGHDLRELLDRSGLRFATTEREMAQRFGQLAAWGVHVRYESRDGTRQEAERYLTATREFCHWAIQKSTVEVHR
jgi:HEPN domain-containing protein